MLGLGLHMPQGRAPWPWTGWVNNGEMFAEADEAFRKGNAHRGGSGPARRPSPELESQMQTSCLVGVQPSALPPANACHLGPRAGALHCHQLRALGKH